ncbi:MAG: DsbA family protein [bacterium]
MTIRSLLIVAIGMIASLGLGGSLISGSNASIQTINSKDKEAIENIIRDYLMANPEVLIDSLDAYYARQALEDEAKAMGALDRYLPELMTTQDGYSIGASPANAKVIVFEFYDYHCGYCKEASQLIANLVKTDPEVRVTLLDLPVLREESRAAAELALAARAQDHFADFHFALMAANGVLSEARIDSIAKKSGINVNQMHKTLAAADYEELLMNTRNIAQDLGFTGTPSFVVASADGSYKQVFSGWNEEGISAAIAEAKAAVSEQ